jgi:hypothetical protein
MVSSTILRYYVFSVFFRVRHRARTACTSFFRWRGNRRSDRIAFIREAKE